MFKFDFNCVICLFIIELVRLSFWVIFEKEFLLIMFIKRIILFVFVIISLKMEINFVFNVYILICEKLV